jgi:hypothetical protein
VYTPANNEPPNGLLPVPAPEGADVGAFVFAPLPNAPPPPKIPPLGADVVPPGVFPAPAPPNAELLVVFAPRLAKALGAGGGAPWVLF